MKRVLLLMGFVALVGCREEDAPLNVDGDGYVQVDSDPQGALISVDGNPRNRFTPDTVDGLAGRRTIAASIDSAGTKYGFQFTADFRPDSVHTILGPLVTSRCTGATTCQTKDHTTGRFGLRRSPMGPLFHQSGQGGGLRWPLGTANSYVSIGSPIVAALIQGSDTVALGIYDTDFMVGRPFPTVQASPFKLDQTVWTVPLPQLITRPIPVIRGLEIREELMATADPEVLLLRLTYTNITNRPSYRALDILMPTTGVTLQQTWLGFAMDADVGEAEDDLFAYAPADNAIFAYDATFREDAFQGEATRPGLVGMRVVGAPTGTTVVMSGWPRELGGVVGDWSAGTFNEAVGFRIMSGTLAYTPDHPDPRIGHLPGSLANDYRIALSAGPVTLAPGESAQIQIAIAVAAPVAGTFTSGTTLGSGEPNDPNRPIMQTAGTLLAKLRAATPAN